MGANRYPDYGDEIEEEYLWNYFGYDEEDYLDERAYREGEQFDPEDEDEDIEDYEWEG